MDFVRIVALQRVVRLAERISGSALPSLQDIYLKRNKSRAVKIIKDSNPPGNRLFILLPSGKHFRSMMAKTEKLRRSFFTQAPKLKLILITFPEQLSMQNCLPRLLQHQPQCLIESSHLYLYSAFNNTNCNKALHSIKIGKLCQ